MSGPSTFILGVSLGFVLIGVWEDARGTQRGSAWEKATLCLVLILVIELIMRGQW